MASVIRRCEICNKKYDVLVDCDEVDRSNDTEEIKMELPNVGGRRLGRTINSYKRAILVLLAEEQMKLSPNNALIAVLCDSIRLAREYVDHLGRVEEIMKGGS